MLSLGILQIASKESLIFPKMVTNKDSLEQAAQSHLNMISRTKHEIFGSLSLIMRFKE